MIYDLTVVVRADIAQKDAQNTLTTLLEKEGFNVSDVSWWNKRELTYPIKKQTHGQYFFATITCSKTNPKSMFTKLNQHEQVLRSLLLVKEHKKENPKIQTETHK
jgi:small subunit ribosomal protein S6